MPKQLLLYRSGSFLDCRKELKKGGKKKCGSV